jgi:branched-chain amino acid transport system ATP-binding protein
MNRVLEARGVSVRFGGVHALDEVDLDVHEGELVGLIGPNGAGKTTLIDAITGFVASEGDLAFDGRKLPGLPPHRRATLGLGRTWQNTELFADLTVRENLMVTPRRRSVRETVGEFLGRGSSEPAAVREAIDLLDLDALADAMPTDLSQGERMLVGVARALAARPRLVCLDEPAAGLDRRESTELGRRLRQVVDAGTSILMVDHDMGLVLDVSDRVVVLEFGKVIAAGTPADVRRDPKVIDAYLGGDAEAQRLATMEEPK